MSAITVILKKLLSGVLYVVNFVKRVFRLFYRPKESNIGELPRFVEPDSIVVNQNDSYNYNQIPPPQTQTSWNSWNDAAFGVESKIEEYRRKQAEAQNKANKGPAEPDYFSDLRPEIKAAKRIELPSSSPAQPRQNLFEFNEDAVNIDKPSV
uniref:Conserved domain protein n=1 Tax=Panagrellus redivivus TaxID=6233 RepID=A0A7E4UR11_PANRE